MAGRLTCWVRSPAAAQELFANVFGSLAALCHAFAGDGEEARALLREVASVLARMEPHDHAVPGSVWFAAAAAWQLGDAAAAAWLSPLVERQEAAGGPPGPMASLDQAAGRIAALRGDTEEAAARFARARVAMEARGLRGVLALLDLDEATVRADRGLAARAPAGLTAREVEVLRLLAKGRTTREIADELVVSPLTVNRHIANVYAKIDVRNRAEATAFA